MKVAQLLDSRRTNWRLLDELCRTLERRRRLPAASIVRFAAVYRAVAADLALAESYQLPPSTVDYLHQLVGRAHNQLYRDRRFRFRAWAAELFYGVPGRLYDDVCIRVAAVLFFGPMILAMWLASADSPLPKFAEQLVGIESLREYEDMYATPPQGRDFSGGAGSTGFYQMHNTTIGLRVFAHGLLFGVGGVPETFHNGIAIGAIFGHLTKNEPARSHFYEFVCAHGPFELSAIVLSAAVGMRLGFALLITGGFMRTESIRRAGKDAMPAVLTTIILFALAALIEGFISPSSLPFEVKAFVAAASCFVLMLYFVVLGRVGRRYASELTEPVTES